MRMLEMVSIGYFICIVELMRAGYDGNWFAQLETFYHWLMVCTYSINY
jgi:hypothetical protein